ncbi:UNVERIFIED_CONTAM: hypothetical protein NCL1_16919 [Trichonephila clavipes]
MRLLTKLDRRGYFSSPVPVKGCVQEDPCFTKWTLAAVYRRMKLSSSVKFCLGYFSTAWAGHQYWSSSHRLKKFSLSSDMGDGSRKCP